MAWWDTTEITNDRSREDWYDLRSILIRCLYRTWLESIRGGKEEAGKAGRRGEFKFGRRWETISSTSRINHTTPPRSTRKERENSSS
jgi:hypothetical protein